ncbi:MAG: ArsR/SmtB family transcription factor [Solirubrobacteraceae bacterium]
MLRALADPRRQQILRLVWSTERSAGEVAAQFDISRPAVSKHLRVLREVGLVEERRIGTQRLYRTRQDGLADVRRFLESFWDDGLEAVKRSAEADARARREPLE